MSDLIISSSILSANFAHLEQDLVSAKQSGVDWIHADVMDGQFVPNISMGPFVIEHCKKIIDMPVDAHLMIVEPEKHIKAFAKAGADRLTIHIEGNPNVYRTLQEIRDLGVVPGIALNPGTPASAIENVLDLVDMVLVMTVNPGFSGQKFIPTMIDKVAQVNRMIQQSGRSISIQVDGGIGAETLPPIYEAGANIVVAATAIFKHPDGIAAGVQAIRNSVL